MIRKIDIGLLIVSLMVMLMLFTVKDYQLAIFRNYYLLEVCKTETVKGFVQKSEVYDDTEGVRSFNYNVLYLFKNKEYTLNESSSPFSVPGVWAKDSVLVKVAPSDPFIASIKSRDIRIFDLLIAVLVSFFEIAILIDFIIGVKRKFKKNGSEPISQSSQD